MLLSVIIPAYNCEKTIDKCIDSITSQDYHNLEIIIINDGSPDNTDEHCVRLAETDNRIRYHKTGNIGVSDTRNMGIQLATGEYITFVDSDDFIEPQMYSRMMKSIKDNNSDICVCGYNTTNGISKSGKKLPFSTETLTGEEISSQYLPLLIGESGSKTLLGSCCCCVYSSSIAKSSSFPSDIKLQEDTLFNLECFSKASRISFVNECFYNYYINPVSATNRYREDAFRQIELLEAKLSSYAEALKTKGIDCSENIYNTMFKWTMFLLKNLTAKDCPYTRADKVKFLKHLFSKQSFRLFVKHFTPLTNKQRLLILLIRVKLYGLLLSLLKG